MGDLHVVEGHLEEARKEFLEAQDIRYGLVRTNPESYGPDLAKTIVAIGMLDMKHEHLPEARTKFLEALKIYEDSAKTNPKFRDDVARLNSLLSQLPGEQGSWLPVLGALVAVAVVVIWFHRKRQHHRAS